MNSYIVNKKTDKCRIYSVTVLIALTHYCCLLLFVLISMSMPKSPTFLSTPAVSILMLGLSALLFVFILSMPGPKLSTPLFSSVVFVSIL